MFSLPSRRITALAFSLTLVVLLLIIGRTSVDQPLLPDISLNAVVGMYAALLVGLALIMPFASAIQAVLTASFARPILIVLACLMSFSMSWLAQPTHEARLGQFPLSLWLIIVHAVVMSGLIVLFVTYKADDSYGRELQRPALLLTGMLVGLLLLLYLLSVGAFMTLDLPDEPWLTSMATNYAENDDLSPSYIASPYGRPDPVLPRYYLLMGIWVKIAGSSLIALRAFSLGFALLTVGLLVWLLRRVAGLSWLPSLGGTAALLGFSAFLRASHSLRMDIGLALYGLLLLWGLLAYFNDNVPRRAALLSGLSLLIGLETVPTVAFTLGAAAGLLMVIHCLVTGWRSRWQTVLIYATGCTLAGLVYFGLHFLPDVSASLDGFQKFNTLYADRTSLGQIRLPFDALFNYHLRFSLSLSPIEAGLIILAVGALWRVGSPAERWTLLVFAVALVFSLVLVSMTYGYWALYAPLAAYAVGRGLQNRGGPLLALVLLPALLSLPVRDLTTALEWQPNRLQLDAIEGIAADIPNDVRVIGDPIFWFPLHRERTYMGWTAISRYARANDLDGMGSLLALNPDIAICSQDTFCELAAQSGLYDDPQEIIAGGTRYLIFRRPET